MAMAVTVTVTSARGPLLGGLHGEQPLLLALTATLQICCR